ncbi:MAG: helix-turn-helix domain-containing protein [Oscillospiraceae bacterium]|nr:helix-turn-helix domain-containing protein [Oscillospiraceae bacterium]
MNRIKELRKKHGMTQKELATQLQIADSTLSYWEMGKYEPDNETLIELSRFFNVPIDYILDGDFIRWDLDGKHVDSGMSVSEAKVSYSTNKNTQAAFGRVEFNDLTQGEIDMLAEYAVFIKSRRIKE